MKLIQRGWIGSNDRRCFSKGDTPHDVYDADLRLDATLHRFNNAAGCAYSAIYVGDDEVWNHVREREADMIAAWNKDTFDWRPISQELVKY